MDYFHYLFLYLSFWTFASVVKFQIDHFWDKKKLIKDKINKRKLVKNEIDKSTPKMATKMGYGKKNVCGRSDISIKT